MLLPPLPIAEPGTKVDDVEPCPALLSAIDGNGHRFGTVAYLKIALGVE